MHRKCHRHRVNHLCSSQKSERCVKLQCLMLRLLVFLPLWQHNFDFFPQNLNYFSKNKNAREYKINFGISHLTPIHPSLCFCATFVIWISCALLPQFLETEAFSSRYLRCSPLMSPCVKTKMKSRRAARIHLTVVVIYDYSVLLLPPSCWLLCD